MMCKIYIYIIYIVIIIFFVIICVLLLSFLWFFCMRQQDAQAVFFSVPCFFSGAVQVQTKVADHLISGESMSNSEKFSKQMVPCNLNHDIWHGFNLRADQLYRDVQLMRQALQIFLKKTLSDVVVYVEHAKRKTESRRESWAEHTKLTGLKHTHQKQK